MVATALGVGDIMDKMRVHVYAPPVVERFAQVVDCPDCKLRWRAYYVGQ